MSIDFIKWHSWPRDWLTRLDCGWEKCFPPARPFRRPNISSFCSHCLSRSCSSQPRRTPPLQFFMSSPDTSFYADADNRQVSCSRSLCSCVISCLPRQPTSSLSVPRRGISSALPVGHLPQASAEPLDRSVDLARSCGQVAVEVSLILTLRVHLFAQRIMVRIESTCTS